MQLVTLIAVAWGPAIVNSTALRLGFDDRPILGSPRGIVGAWLFTGIATLTVIALTFAYVKPSRLGLFLPRDDRRKGWRTWVKMLVWGIGVSALTYGLRRWQLSIGVPANGLLNDYPMVADLAWSLRAGVFEEIPMAAMVCLMLRLRWGTGNILLVMMVLRVWFHLFQGPAAVLPVCVFAAGFAYLFIVYKRVGPLIAAHTIYDMSLWTVYALGGTA